MKKFKTIDYWVSGILIIASFINAFLQKGDGYLLGYIIVGSWQIASMLVHIFNGSFVNRNGVRNNYHWLCLFCLLSIPVGSFVLLLFTAPFMAIFYTCLCYYEVNVKMRRPLALLK